MYLIKEKKKNNISVSLKATHSSYIERSWLKLK